MKFRDFLNEKYTYEDLYREFGDDSLDDDFFSYEMNNYRVNGELDYESIINDYWDDFVKASGKQFIKASKKLK